MTGIEETIVWYAVSEKPTKPDWYLISYGPTEVVETSVAKWALDWETKWLIGPIVYWAEMPHGPQ